MKKLVTNKPLRVASIFFKGKQQPLRNRIVWIAGNYLVVAKDENDTAPHMVQRRQGRQTGRRRTDAGTLARAVGTAYRFLLTAIHALRLIAARGEQASMRAWSPRVCTV